MLNIKAALAEDILSGVLDAQKAAEIGPIDQMPPVVVTQAEKPEHGDYASPIALSLSKKLNKDPLDIVAIIASHMPKKEYVGKIDAAPPGFLNIILNPGWLTARLDDVIEADVCSDITVGQGKRLNFEFISANPTGPLTLGNARTAFSVDTLANVLTCAGFNITREYYINDAGQQIRRLGESIIRRALMAQGKKVDYPDDLYQGKYITKLAEDIAEKRREDEAAEFHEEDLENKEIMGEVSRQAVNVLLADIKKTIEEDLKIHFDQWTSEQALRDNGIVDKAIEQLRQKKVTYVKNGTEFIKTTDYGDTEDRVLIKKDGEYAYIAPDIGYHLDKFNRQFDGIFTFVGADHQGHAPKLMAAMEALGHDTKKLRVIAAQWMRIVRDGKTVKLSKRAGEIYSPKDLIDEVGYDAARFFMVQHSLTTHMEFNLNLAKERSERNPVYYVQYAHVRLQSILRRAKEIGIIEAIGDALELTSSASLTHTSELNLMRKIYQLPELISDIAESFDVHALAYYAIDLAKAVHSMYRHVPVLAADNEEIIKHRLQLVLAARNTMAKTLDLLGISKPDVM